MDNIKLSFIIPIYRVGYKNLSRCISSIGSAMKLVKNSELIIVDDGSPLWDEECKAIPTDPRCKLIRHPKNICLGAARNTGLKNASGEWVWFIDSDDNIMPHSILTIMKYIKENPNADLFQMGAIRVNEKGEESPMYFNQFESTKLYGAEILNATTVVPPCEWSKIYRRSFLLNHNIWNPEDALFEDQELLAKVAVACNECVVIPMPTYKYRYNSESDMNCKWDAWHAFSAYKVTHVAKSILSCLPTDVKIKRLEEYKLTDKLISDSYSKFSLLEKLRYKFRVIKWKLTR